MEYKASQSLRSSSGWLSR